MSTLALLHILIRNSVVQCDPDSLVAQTRVSPCSEEDPHVR